MMKYEELEVIRRETGCGQPCNYVEYKFHGGGIPSSFNTSGNEFVFSLLAQTRYTSMEREEILKFELFFFKNPK